VTEETEDAWYPEVVEDEALQLNKAQHTKSSENRVASPSDIGVCEKKLSDGEVEIQQPTEQLLADHLSDPVEQSGYDEERNDRCVAGADKTESMSDNVSDSARKAK